MYICVSCALVSHSTMYTCVRVSLYWRLVMASTAAQPPVVLLTEKWVQEARVKRKHEKGKHCLQSVYNLVQVKQELALPIFLCTSVCLYVYLSVLFACLPISQSVSLAWPPFCTSGCIFLRMSSIGCLPICMLESDVMPSLSHQITLTYISNTIPPSKELHSL